MSTPLHPKKREMSESSALASEKRARMTLSKPFRSPLVARPKPQSTGTESALQTPISQKKKDLDEDSQEAQQSIGPKLAPELSHIVTPTKNATTRTSASNCTTFFDSQANNPLT